MDFKQLEVFVAVAKHKSFSKAANELFITQPTVSSHIQNLEKELDSTLINRNNKQLTLTKSGDIFYSNAIEILNNCKKAIYDIKEYSSKIEGFIDIACSSIPETYILPDFLKNFYNTFPNVKFSISHFDSQLAINEVIDEKASFGLVGSKVSNNQIKYIDLIDDELVLIAPLSLNLNDDNGYVSLDQLLDLKFIMRKSGSGTKDLIYNTFSSKGVDMNTLNIISYVESNESIKEMVRLGLGVSFVSYISTIDYLSTNKVKFYKIKDVSFLRKFYFIYSKRKVFTPLEQKFLDSICEYFNVNK